MSPVRFRCPHCAGTFQVEPQPREQQVNCTHCRGVVKIPASAPVAAVGGGGGIPQAVAPPNINVGGPQVVRPTRVAPSIEIEPDSPLKPERPTAIPTIPTISTHPDQLSIHEVLRHGRAHKVSDIHVAPGSPVMFRIARKLVPANDRPLTSKQSERLSLQLLNEHQEAQFRKDLDFDYMAIDDYGRYRVNVGYFDGDVGTVIRILAQRPKTLDELKLPDVVRDLATATKGLVLLTGSASQGKTTTMTAIIDAINATQPRHIITIEDPIEYLHTNKTGLVRQRQIGRDTQDFHSGLRAALRQNPDVISIGEMRDFETIKIALTAAETGCLVLSTLHIMSIDKIIERLLSFVPTEDEGHIRYVLADTLVGIIHQELVPARDGGKRVAAEILVVNQGHQAHHSQPGHVLPEKRDHHRPKVWHGLDANLAAKPGRRRFDLARDNGRRDGELPLRALPERWGCGQPLRKSGDTNDRAPVQGRSSHSRHSRFGADDRFYVERLGFELSFRDASNPTNYAGLRRGAVELHFQWQDEHEMSTTRLRILIEDPDALFHEYQDKQVFHERTRLADTPWGTREFAFYDLDGNGLTFYRDL